MPEGDWHKHQKSFFVITEKAVGNKRADAIANNVAFEFQDKHDINKEEIDLKEDIFSDNGYQTAWILNMNHRAIIINNLLYIDEIFANKYKEREL